MMGARTLPNEFIGDDGFTILELLVVIMILGLLVSFVAPAALHQLRGAKTDVAHQQIERLGSVLDLYNLDLGVYPTSQQGLAVLVTKPSDLDSWRGPYLKGDQIPKDPWTRPWLYRSPSDRIGHDYDLCTAGIDGKGTGPGEGGAICN